MGNKGDSGSSDGTNEVCWSLSCVTAEHENAYNTVYNNDDGSEEHKGKLSHEVVSGRGLVISQSLASSVHA